VTATASTKGTRSKKDHDERTRRADAVGLLAVVIVLNAIGLLMVLSASSVQSLKQFGSSWVFFQRDAVWVAVGAVALIVSSRIDYRRWERVRVPLLGGAMLLLVAVLVPSVGTDVYGSSRWLRFGPVSVQPSELAKLGLAVFAAALLARRFEQMDDTHLTLRPILLVFGALALLVMGQPDMGTTMVLATITITVTFVAGAPMIPLSKVMAAGAAAALLAARLEPYRWARMNSFRDPFADAGDSGYQLAQSLVGLGSGGLTGLGLGASRAKWGFLPNAHTDFIFAIIGEELGLLGSLLIIALFVTFTVFGVRIALRAPDRFGTLLAAAITAWIAGQAFMNLGVVVGLLPVTGVPLPFVSFGGSALVVTMAATGILLNIARQDRPAPAR
jgi:cell division protein FtsW